MVKDTEVVIEDPEEWIKQNDVAHIDGMGEYDIFKANENGVIHAENEDRQIAVKITHHDVTCFKR